MSFEQRELKFRVWDKVDSFSHFTLEDLMLGKIQFTNDCPVMQCINQYDDDKELLWEGDIARMVIAWYPAGKPKTDENWTKMEMMGVVYYNDTVRTCYSLRVDGGMQPLWCEEYTRVELKKLGNIYEHPELLKTTA